MAIWKETAGGNSLTLEEPVWLWLHGLVPAREHHTRGKPHAGGMNAWWVPVPPCTTLHEGQSHCSERVVTSLNYCRENVLHYGSARGRLVLIKCMALD